MKTFKPALSILSKEQRAFLPGLAPAKDLGFTLYGGTAIALRLGHRASVDFDFFTERGLDKEALYRAMPALAGEVLQESADTLVLSVAPKGMQDPVKVAFFATISFGRFGEPELTDDRVLRVASLDDLMATKLKAILDREERKDYDDLAALIEAKVDVSKGLAIARQMYRGFNPQVALTALTYFDKLPRLPAKSKRLLVHAARAVRELPDVRRASHSLSERTE
ncbi:MAG: nucleotidyl transferase AbiEii/AbiGii toxin family protein [Burkholderiales bacterium]